MLRTTKNTQTLFFLLFTEIPETQKLVVYVYVDGQMVCSEASFVKAMERLMGFFYIFNISYPKQASWSTSFCKGCCWGSKSVAQEVTKMGWRQLYLINKNKVWLKINFHFKNEKIVSFTFTYIENHSKVSINSVVGNWNHFLQAIKLIWYHTKITFFCFSFQLKITLSENGFYILSKNRKV